MSCGSKNNECCEMLSGDWLKVSERLTNKGYKVVVMMNLLSDDEGLDWIGEKTQTMEKAEDQPGSEK